MRKLLLAALVLIGNMAQAQIPNWLPTNQLAGWYPFNGNAADSSPNGNHAATINNANLVSDRFGNANNAYEFDGYSSYIEVPDHPSLHARKITMSVWVYRDSTKYGGIINKANRINAYNEAYGINTRESSLKKNSNCLPGTGWQKTVYSKPLTQGRWLHIVTTLDGDTIRNYINDTLDSKLVMNALIDSCVGGNLIFGYHWDGASSDGFDGKIDNISIYNRALSPCEIHRLYRQNHTGITTQPQNVTGKSDGSVQFSIAAPGTGLTYQWQQNTGSGFANISNGSIFSGVNNDTLWLKNISTPMHNTSYRCIVSAPGLCPDTSNIAVLSVSVSVVDRDRNNTVSVYPNPATSEIMIKAGVAGSNYYIVDQLGRKTTIGEITGMETRVSIINLSSGIYFVRIDGVADICKFTKQ